MTDEESTMMDESPCIKCARCVEVCPVHLQPFNLEALVSLNLIEEAKEDHILDCECGSCSYICLLTNILLKRSRSVRVKPEH